MSDDDAVTFPGLAIAAKRLGLDVGEVAEAVLHAVDCGQDEQEAMRMTLMEFLQRRGLYRGALRAAVESGEVFQVAEDLTMPDLHKNAAPAETRRDCTACRHEPVWAKCLSTDTWLHGRCERTGQVLNKRRRYCYSWDARIENCGAWKPKGDFKRVGQSTAGCMSSRSECASGPGKR